MKTFMQNPFLDKKIGLLWVILLSLITIFTACTKGPTPTPMNGINNNNGNNGGNQNTGTAILLKQITYLNSGTDLDANTTLFSYDGNNNLVTREDISTGLITGPGTKTVHHSDDTTHYTYNVNSHRISSRQNGFSNSNFFTNGILITKINSISLMNNSYRYSGNLLASLSSTNTSNDSQTGLGIINPILSSLMNYDSTTYTYDASGILSTATFYLQTKGKSNPPFTDNFSFTFSGKNLTQMVLSVTTSLGSYTTTTTYEYDNKIANNGLDIINGIQFNTTNNIVKITEVTTGAITSQKTTNYSYTYDSLNRPVTGTGTITQSMNGGPAKMTQISSVFTYKN